MTTEMVQKTVFQIINACCNVKYTPKMLEITRQEPMDTDLREFIVRILEGN